jgi:hypothetical protein
MPITKSKAGRKPLPAAKRTVWTAARISPEASRLLRFARKMTPMSTGKLLSHIIVKHFNGDVSQH